jgi:hypothetical protein
MYDPNLNRWIYASVVKHFKEAADASLIPFYIDRYDRDVSWAELRFSGPYINEVNRNTFIIICNVDILCTSFIEQDQYNIYRMTGVFSSAFKDICVYRYGDGPNDDRSYVSDLKLTKRDNNYINIINYGLMFPDNKFQRSAVFSDFEMYLP